MITLLYMASEYKFRNGFTSALATWTCAPSLIPFSSEYRPKTKHEFLTSVFFLSYLRPQLPRRSLWPFSMVIRGRLKLAQVLRSVLFEKCATSSKKVRRQLYSWLKRAAREKRDGATGYKLKRWSSAAKERKRGRRGTPPREKYPSSVRSSNIYVATNSENTADRAGRRRAFPSR